LYQKYSYPKGWEIAISQDTLLVTNFVQSGMPVPVEMGKPVTVDIRIGINRLDTLAEGSDGDVVMSKEKDFLILGLPARRSMIPVIRRRLGYWPPLPIRMRKYQ
jgi:hypothetical protein